MLVGNRLKMHTIVAFISLVGGLMVFGASGLILGPVVLAITMVLVEVWRQRGANPPGRLIPRRGMRRPTTELGDPAKWWEAQSSKDKAQGKKHASSRHGEASGLGFIIPLSISLTSARGAIPRFCGPAIFVVSAAGCVVPPFHVEIEALAVCLPLLSSPPNLCRSRVRPHSSGALCAVAWRSRYNSPIEQSTVTVL